MSSKLLSESPPSTLARSGSLWSATLLTPGKGSSGFYSEAMLEANAAAAFPKGTKHWFGHPEDPAAQRDPRDQWGVLTEDASYEPGKGIVGKIQVLPHWQTVVESLAEAGQADLSIWAMGEADDSGNVTALLPDRQNSVDLVGYPGRPGSALTSQMLESARALGASPRTEASGGHPKEGSMEIAELVEAVKANTTAITALVAEQKAATDAAKKSEATAADTASAIESALARYNVQAKAIDDAKLFESQVTDLKARALKGEDVTALIESAKTIVAEATQHVTATVTRSGGQILSAESVTGFGVRTWEARS